MHIVCFQINNVSQPKKNLLAVIFWFFYARLLWDQTPT